MYIYYKIIIYLLLPSVYLKYLNIMFKKIIRTINVVLETNFYDA